MSTSAPLPSRAAPPPSADVLVGQGAVTTAIDRAELNRLRWRCRRGLLENDLLIERFFARHAATLTAEQARGLEALMELADNDLLDLLLARTEPGPALARDEVRQVLDLMRARHAAGAGDDAFKPMETLKEAT